MSDEEEVLNISLIANSLLDLETSPPAEDVSADNKKYYQRNLRKVALELHHELGEELSGQTVTAHNTYMEALYEFCRLENSPQETDEWKEERDKHARSLLAHLHNHAVIVEKAQSPEWPPSLEQDELKKFVTEWVAGRLFSSFHCRSMDDIPRVFMAIGMGALDDRAMFELKDVALVYEYTDKAGPMAMNGMPMFFSCRIMNHTDWERCRKAIDKLQKANEELEV